MLQNREDQVLVEFLFVDPVNCSELVLGVRCKARCMDPVHQVRSNQDRRLLVPAGVADLPDKFVFVPGTAAAWRVVVAAG